MRLPCRRSEGLRTWPSSSGSEFSTTHVRVLCLGKPKRSLLAVDAVTWQLEGFDAQALYCLRSKGTWSRRFIGCVDSAYPAARS